MMNKDSNTNSPKFYKGWGLLFYSFRAASKYFFLQKRIIAKSGLLSTLKNFIEIIKLRRKLFLTKVIKFNNRYYSTPIVPSFPSNAFNVMIQNGGHNFQAAGTPKKQHIDSAFLAITNRCNLNCVHCYEQHNLYGNATVPVEKWIDTIQKLQGMGVSIIILTGGEPLIEFDKLTSILEKADKKLSEFHIHTSGDSITIEKAKKLKDLGLTAVAIGLDHFEAIKNDNIRGEDSYNNAINALKIFNDVGILTYVNLCATSSLIRTGELWKYYDLMKQLKVSIIQLLEPRPFGGLYNSDLNKIFSAEDKTILEEFMKKGNTEKRFKDHPLIYYVAHIEGADQMGCSMGGLSHFYIDSKGNVNPCVFLPVTFGNIMDDNFKDIYAKMRKAIPTPVHGECPSVVFSNSIVKKNKEENKIPIIIEDIQEEWSEMYKNQD